MDLQSSLRGSTHHDFVGDVQQLQSLKTGDGVQTREGLETVAKEFESMYLKMMLDSMRKAEKVWAKDNPFGSREQDMFRDMLDAQLSKELSVQGSLGLADMLVRQMAPHLGLEEKEPLHSSSESPFAISPPQQMGPSSDRADTRLIPKMEKSSSLPSQSVAPAPGYHDALDFAGDPDLFTEKLMPYAVKAGQALGIDPKLLVSQAALETGWGRSLKQEGHGLNLFGIKTGSQWQGQSNTLQTHEVYDGHRMKQMASFRAYDSIQASFDDYVALIQSRYSDTGAQQDPAAYMQNLSDKGYATDPIYVEKVLAVYNSKRIQQASLEPLETVAMQTPPMTVATAITGNQSDPRLQIW